MIDIISYNIDTTLTIYYYIEKDIDIFFTLSTIPYILYYYTLCRQRYPIVILNLKPMTAKPTFKIKNLIIRNLE